MLIEVPGSGGGGGGEDPRKPPRASVALTAQQWSALTLAISHGVGVIKTSKTMPLKLVSEALRDIAEATEEIQRRLQCEALRRGKPE